MRPLAVVLLLASLALLAVPSAVLSPTTNAATPVPCRDPRGCPDMTIDLSELYVGHQDQVNIAPGSCLITEGYVPSPGLKTLVRFDIGAPNVGEGDLVLGAPWENPDLFFFSTCHSHWHLRDYVTTRIWTLTGWANWELLRQQNPDWTAAQTFAAHPELLSETTFAAKISFCAVDIYPLPVDQGGATVPDLLKYDDCGNQGVSKGWSDLYIWSQTGNWADATGLAPGPYMLEAEVNANHIFQEESYANNRGAVPIVIYPCEAGVCDLPL